MPQIKKFLDENGLQHFADKLNDYPTNEILGVVINAIGEELETKANSADLADVATSGNYTDLSNTPQIDTIPTDGSDNLITSDAVYNALTDVREIAEGKKQSLVCSITDNPILNTQNTDVIITTLTDINAQTYNASDLAIGDTVYIKEEYLPDRWVSKYSRGTNLFNAETSRLATVGVLQDDGGYFVSNPGNIGIWTPSSKIVFNGEANKQYQMSGSIKSTSTDMDINIALGWFYSDGSIGMCGTRGSFTEYTLQVGTSATNKTVVGIGVYYSSRENIYIKDLEIRDADSNVISGAVLSKIETTKVPITSISVNNTNINPVNTNVNISVPTQTSDITNNSGFITINDVPYELYECTYGTTTFEEITAQLDAGKFPILNYSPAGTSLARLTYNGKVSNKYYFFAMFGSNYYYATVGTNNVWGNGASTIQTVNSAIKTGENKTSNNYNYYSALKEDELLALKQDILTFDNTPTQNSNNPVKSAGIYNAIEDIREVAEGKNSAYVCSIEDNAILNSQEDSLIVYNPLTAIDDASLVFNALNIGDTIYITDANVPDRWVSSFLDKHAIGYTEGNTVQADTPSPTAPTEIVSDIYYTNEYNPVILRGIGDYKDTYENGVLTRNIGVKIFNGSESLTSTGDTYGLAVYSTAYNVKVNTPVLCSHFPCSLSGSPINSISNGTSVYNFRFNGNSDIVDSTSGATKQRSFANWFAEQYTNGTPVTVYYPLETPTTENVILYEITERGGMVLNKLETAKVPISSISVNSNLISPINNNIDITVPTTTNDLINNSNFITNATAQIGESQVINLVEDLQSIRETAEGKKQTFVCSAITNQILNNQNAVIALSTSLTDVSENEITLSQLQIGDTIYIPEADIPDRWIGAFLDKAELNLTYGNSSQNEIPSALVPVEIASDIYYDNFYHPIELRGIGNYKDYYNDSIITRAIGVYTFTGTEPFDNGATGVLAGYRVLRNTSLYNNLIPIVSTEEPFYCTHFTTAYTSTYTVPNQLTRWQSGTTPTIQGMFCISEEILGIDSNATQGEAVAAFQSWLQSEYESGHPVKVYFPLKETETVNETLYAIGPRTGANLYILETAKVPISSVSVNGTAINPINQNVNITVPTSTLELTNDNGFITLPDVPSELYWCTYGTTTYTEITTAIAAGKLPVCIYNNKMYIYCLKEGQFYFFTSAYITSSYYLRINTSNTWAIGNALLQNTNALVTTLSSSSTNTEYPSAKAVYDAIEDIREVATGKKQTYVVDIAHNTDFNSQDSEITITHSLVDVENTTIPFSQINIGDTIYVTDENVPDRWVSEFQDRTLLTTAEGSSSQASVPSPSSPVLIVSTIYYDRQYQPVELRGIGTAKDTYENGIITRNIGMIDLGTLGWSKNADRKYFVTSSIPFKRPAGTGDMANLMCEKYQNIAWAGITSATTGIGGNFAGQFLIYDPDYASYTEAQFVAAISGTIVYYECSTPTEESIALYNIGPRTGIIVNKVETAKVPISSISVNNTTLTPINSNINITVPTATSDLINDSDFATISDIPQGVFKCTYGTTTYAEITQALNDGKLPYVILTDGRTLTYYKLNGGQHQFAAAASTDPRVVYARVNSSNSWISGVYNFEQINNKVTELSSSSTDTQYPSAKCVYDALELKQDSLTINTTPTAGTDLWNANTIINYIASRGQQLITNGTALLGNNYNFSHFTFDGSDSNGSGGCFIPNAGVNPYTDEYIAVTKKNTYRLTYDLKPNFDFSSSGINSSGINGFLPYLRQFDVDKFEIYDYNTNYGSGTLVQLTQDLNPGDHTIYLSDVSHYVALTSNGRTLQIWDYINSKGYRYGPGEYTRHVYNVGDGSTIDTTNNTITATNAYNGSSIVPAGTYISQNRGGGYAYIGSYDKPAAGVWSSWTHDTTASTIRSGCAYVSIGWLWQYNLSATSHMTSWDDTISYPIGRAVKYNDTCYISKQTVPAGTLPTDTNYWHTINSSSLSATCKTKITNIQFGIK